LMCYDATINRFFYLIPSGSTWILQAYEATSLTFAGNITITGVSGTPSSLIRCGTDAFAFRTDANQLFLIKTSLISTNPLADISVKLAATAPPYVSGSNLVALFTITNNGPFAADLISWTNNIVGGGAFVNAQATLGGAIVSGSLARGTISNLPSQGSVIVTLTLQAPSGMLALTGGATSSSLETNLANNTASLPLWVRDFDSQADSILNVAVKDIARDPIRPRLYLSVGSSAAVFPNTILVMDFDQGTVTTLPMMGDPGRMAISLDGQFLYVGMDNSAELKRVALNSGIVDLSIALPSGAAVLQMAVCPTNSRLVAITRSNDGKVAAYEDDVPRPNELAGYVGLLAFSDTTAELFTCSGTSSDVPLYRVDTSAGGLNIIDQQAAKPGSITELKFARGLLHYNNGWIVDPQARRVVATLPVSYNAVVEPDLAANRIFALAAPDSGPGWALRAYDGDQFIDVGSSVVTSNTPSTLLRWGKNGFAFRTGAQVYLLHSKLVPTNPPTDIALRGSVSASSVTAGQPIEYSLSLTNSGTNSAYALVLTQAFSLTVTAVTAAVDLGVATGTSNLITWTLDALAPASTATMTVTLQPVQNGTLVSRAAVRHSANDPSLKNNLALNVTSVGQAPTNEIRELSLNARKLLFDPFRNAIYATVVAREPFIGNSVVSVDPVTAQVEPLYFAGSEPNQMALSDYGQFLYVSLNGTMGVHRVDLSGRLPDLSFPFSTNVPFNAFDLKVQPKHPQTIAASLVDIRTAGDYSSGVFLFDNEAGRPSVSGATKSIEFSGDGQRIYGSVTFGAGFGFQRLAVTATGTSQIDVDGAFFDDYELKLQGTTLYTALGRAIDPNIPVLLKEFGVNGTIEPDMQRGRIFQIPVSDTTTELRAYSVESYELLGSVPLPNAKPYARNLIRCGDNRLAFRTDAGQLFLIRTVLADGLPLPPANLTLLQTAAVDPLPPGGRVVFTTIVTNNSGTVVSNAVLTFLPPSGVATLNVVPSQGSVTSIAPAFICNLGALLPNGSAMVQTIATVTNSSVLTNLASVSSGRMELDVNDNTATNIVAVPYAGPSGATYFSGFAAREIAYDPASGRLFASANDTNVVAVVNPTTATIEEVISVGLQPAQLAISSGGEFLYVAVSNGLAITRIQLRPRTVSTFVLTSNGTLTAMTPLANDPASVAVAQGRDALVVYTDGVPRLNPLTGGYWFRNLQPIPGTSEVFAYGPTGHPSTEVYKLSISADGIAIIDGSPPDLIFYFNNDIKLRAGRLMFASGQIVNPFNWTIEATLGGNNHVETDPSGSFVFYAGGTSSGTLTTWNRAAKQLVDTKAISGINGGISSLVWCGGDRLAFHTADRIYIVRTPWIGAADLTVIAAVGTNMILAGSDVTLLAWVTNRGPASATNTILMSTLPPYTSIITATSSQGSALISSNVVFANMGTIATNSLARLDVHVQFTNSVNVTLTNILTATSLSPEVLPEDNSKQLVFVVRADNDRDGLADDWEIEFFGSLNSVKGGPDEDYDGDGISNMQEFLAETDPTDSLNVLHVKELLLGETTIRVSFFGVNGHSYQVEKAAIVTGPWTTLVSPLLGTGHQISITNAIDQNPAFYRVRLLQ